MNLFVKNLLKIRSISLDMSATCLKLCHEQMPCSEKAVDKFHKFHVMQYVYDAVWGVRFRIQKELAKNLTKGKEKTKEDREILYRIELLKRCRYRLTQSCDQWDESGKETMERGFENHKELQVICELSQDFKKWYDKSNCCKSRTRITEELYNMV